MIRLTRETVVPYLVERGLIAEGRTTRVGELGGGVSCTVLDVTQGAQRIVVKQALERLRVADEWLAPASRAVTEADALRLGAELTPGAVPRLLDSDPDNSVLAIERAPQDWRDWKQALLEGDVDTDVAAWLGYVCATWHSGTLDDRAVEAAFAHSEAFESLRIDPYYRTVSVRHPELRPAITAAIGRLEAGRCCLVHGDFSPKNVLVGTGGRWVIDFEVAHYGNPVFDVAFMLNHLFLKAIHRPTATAGYAAAARAFADAYRRSASLALVAPVPRLLEQVGCLMLGRVDGKSPAEYLDRCARERAWELGLRFLQTPPGSIEDAWLLLAEGAAR